LDILLGELKRRFSDVALEVAESSEQFLSLNEECARPFMNIYSVPGINHGLLKVEMSVLRNVMKSSDVNLKDAPLKHMVERMKKNTLQKGIDIYPNVSVLLKICLTLPSNNDTCERSFSVMRCVNNWLRCIMNQERFWT